MSDTQQLALSIQPAIAYPREAQVGKTYLMSIDLYTSGDKWPYEEEEYPIYCMLNTSPLFSSKPAGEPAVVLHRFGGSYGAAQFLLTAALQEMEGEIKITLVTKWGVPIKVISLDDVKITQEVNHALRIIGEHEQEAEIAPTQFLEIEFQESIFLEESQEFANLGGTTVVPEGGTSDIAHSLESLANSYQEKRYQEKLRQLSSPPEPSLNLAIAGLLNTGTDNFAIWVVKAPYPSGYVLRDCVWPVELTQVWQEWQQMFAGHSRLDISQNSTSQKANLLPIDVTSPRSGQTTAPYSSRLMQYLAMNLWRWVFDGQILSSLERSRGIAMGQHTRLRFRLEIRDPDLIALPWEIMQREPGQSAMSFSQDLLFSRTSSEVEALPYLRTDQALSILLVLGHDDNLQLEQEAAILQQSLVDTPGDGNSQRYAPCIVNKLIQPTPQELIQELETEAYNVFFYAGHGLPDPDGGLLFLRPDMPLNGIELAQVLTRTGVKLALFNACWGAQPAAINHQAIPASSLAEVLIRHGVPAVLGMRDEIEDHESHSFIQAFTEALRSHKPIDEAVAQARQELLTLYRFNQPAWTLPILYLHPDFNGELVKSFVDGSEENEVLAPEYSTSPVNASLRSLAPKGKTWLLRYGVTRIGRMKDNDIVIPEPSISKRHAEIFCRNTLTDATLVRTYYLQDFSTYGTTWFLGPNGWQQILREEVPLKSGMQLKFGSARGETWEFIIEDS